MEFVSLDDITLLQSVMFQMITLAYNPAQGGTEGLQLQVRFFLAYLGLNSLCLFYPNY